MGNSSDHLRSDLANARGLGSAKDGTGHWVWQRITAIALIPLSLWFMYHLLMTIMGATHTQIGAFLAEPISAIIMATLIIAACAHAKLGMQVIIEDYVHSHGAKNLLLFLNIAVFWILGIISMLAIIKLHLGA